MNRLNSFSLTNFWSERVFDRSWPIRYPADVRLNWALICPADNWPESEFLLAACDWNESLQSQRRKVERKCKLPEKRCQTGFPSPPPPPAENWYPRTRCISAARAPLLYPGLSDRRTLHYLPPKICRCCLQPFWIRSPLTLSKRKTGGDQCGEGDVKPCRWGPSSSPVNADWWPKSSAPPQSGFTASKHSLVGWKPRRCWTVSLGFELDLIPPPIYTPLGI